MAGLPNINSWCWKSRNPSFQRTTKALSSSHTSSPSSSHRPPENRLLKNALPFLYSNLSPFTMELEQSGSTVPLHSPERLLLLPLPSVPPETMTTMSSFPQWESSIAVVEPRMLYWARVKKLFKYCQLSDADDQSCLVTPAWPCSSVSHYGLLHTAGRWHNKPKKKKTVFTERL